MNFNMFYLFKLRTMKNIFLFSFALGIFVACDKEREAEASSRVISTGIQFFAEPNDSFRLRINETKTLIVKVDFDSTAQAEISYSLENAIPQDDYFILDLRGLQYGHNSAPDFTDDVARFFSNADAHTSLESVLSSGDTIRIAHAPPKPDFYWFCSCNASTGVGGGCYQRTYGSMMYCDGSQCLYCSFNIVWGDRVIGGPDISSILLYSI